MFSIELCQTLGLGQRSPAEARRNIIVRGADLNELIREDFEVQGVRFHGTEECRPCYWMDRAIAPGAEEFLKGRGGLRAKILTDGRLRSISNCGHPDPAVAGEGPRLQALRHAKEQA